MKKIQWIMMGIVLMLTYSCKSNIYSEQLKAERALIENYIERQGIVVVDTLPADDKWGEKVYYRVPDYDNFYFHMVELGDTLSSAEEAEIESGETVLLRYKRYTLNEYPDTIYNWTTMDSSEPIKLQYMVSSETSCTGWQVALKYMRYSDSQCKIICPSKMGFSDENSSVTPYGYDLKIKIKRY
jgi:hypothetical protein